MDIGFAEALLVVGVLLVAGAGLSGWLHGTVLSISVLSVAAGIALALAGVIEADPTAAVVVFAVELALVLTLFSDGLFGLRRRVLRDPRLDLRPRPHGHGGRALDRAAASSSRHVVRPAAAGGQGAI